MNSSTSEARSVDVDVLPPVPGTPFASPGSTGTSRIPFEGLKTFYHPASGVVILGLDWLVFGTDLMTGFLALPVMCVVAFLTSFIALMAIQLNWSKDAKPVAMGKAFLGAFLVALPFPITGTLLGAGILALAGLPHHPVELLKKVVQKSALTR